MQPWRLKKASRRIYEGSEVFFINEYWNMAGVEAETLAQLFYPDVTRRKRALDSKECLDSIDKARRMLGYQPEGRILDWVVQREYPPETVRHLVIEELSSRWVDRCRSRLT